MVFESLQRGILEWFQEISNPFLDGIFYAITEMGDVFFYIFILTFLYWNISKEISLKIIFMMMVSFSVNTGIKNTVKEARPFYDPQFTKGISKEVTGFSFPSGHSQNTATCFYALNHYFQKKWLKIAGILFIVFVPISRVYFRVHWPQDVVAGVIIGLLVGYLYDKYLDTFFHTFIFKYYGYIILSVLMFVSAFIIEDSDPPKAFGALSGILIGYVLERRFVKFDTANKSEKNHMLMNIVRQILGIIILLAIKEGLKIVMPDSNPMEFIRYGAIGISITLVIPYFYTLIGLLPKENRLNR